LFAGRPGIFRVGGKTAGDQFNLAVEIRGHAMDRADESALAAADHAVTKFAFVGHKSLLF
jgi:hypothetical protein